MQLRQKGIPNVISLGAERVLPIILINSSRHRQNGNADGLSYSTRSSGYTYLAQARRSYITVVLTSLFCYDSCRCFFWPAPPSHTSPNDAIRRDIATDKGESHQHERWKSFSSPKRPWRAPVNTYQGRFPQEVGKSTTITPQWGTTANILRFVQHESPLAAWDTVNTPTTSSATRT